MEDFQKVRLEKDLAELKKLIDTHFAQVNSGLLIGHYGTIMGRPAMVLGSQI